MLRIALYARVSTQDQHPEAQQMKTVFRRHAKWLPSSPTMQRAITLDEQAETGQPQDLEPLDMDGALVDQTAAPAGLGPAIDAWKQARGGHSERAKP